MARHARPTRFKVVVGGLFGGDRHERVEEARTPGAALGGHRPPDHAAAARERTDDESLRRFLGAMRRWQAAEGGPPAEVDPATIRHTADYVLSGHLDAVDEPELAATIATLRDYASALIDAADSHLDAGRAVVRQVLEGARAVADVERLPSRADARRAAETIRDLLFLLDREGWQDSPTEAAS